MTLLIFELNAQETGSAPYVSQFGINQVQINSGANWKVTNKDENNIIFVVVNIGDRVVAHSFIKKRESYMFKDLPIGSYYYKFSAAENYFENKKLIKFEGCDPGIYICNGGAEWDLEVWVERTNSNLAQTGKISKKSFFNNSF